MNKLLRASIWAPGSVPAEEWKYRNLTRIMLPLIDVFFSVAGIAAGQFGVPAIDEFFPKLAIVYFAHLLFFTGVISLLGVAFPSLWSLEIFGKVLILGLMVAYMVSLLIVTASGNTNRGFFLFIVAVVLCPIVWRLSVLGAEWQTRRLERKGV